MRQTELANPPAKPKAIRSVSVKRIACLSGQDACSIVAAMCWVDGLFVEFQTEEKSIKAVLGVTLLVQGHPELLRQQGRVGSHIFSKFVSLICAF